MAVQPSTWNTAAAMVWVTLFLIMITYEITSGINKGPTLTQVVVRYVPAPVALGFIIWLLFHFAARYGNQPYVRWVRGQ